MLFFSGDQVYEGDLTGGVWRPLDKALLDYLDKWYRWCWAFGDLARDIPCICIPDDHDVYHGNLWGDGGHATDDFGKGGYYMPAEFVKMVGTFGGSYLGCTQWLPAREQPPALRAMAPSITFSGATTSAAP